MVHMNATPELGHIMEYQRWQDFGVCTSLYAEATSREAIIALDRIFFGKSGRPKLVAAAVEWCMDCPVKQLCFEYAVVHNMRYGVWGGLSTQQRDRYVALQPSLRTSLLEQAVQENWLVDSLLSSAEQDWAQVYRKQLRAEKNPPEAQVHLAAVATPLLFLDAPSLPEFFWQTETSSEEPLVG